MENEIVAVPEAEPVQVVDIQFRPGQKVYYFDPAGLALQPGDYVILDTARGPEYGVCASGVHTIAQKDVVSPLRGVLRLATAQDERVVAENRTKERKAHEVCLQKIDELGLDMQLVSVECAFDGSKLLFFFTADERVDFRELVKNLAFIFHTRIELRQIGVRDKAKMVGGLGICGRPFCCASFLDDFQPVSIKMAKTQNLSLNPTKISGACGRLMCCLKYEQDAYEDLLRRVPKEESFVDTPEGRGTVTEVILLRQQVKVRLEDSPETISLFHTDEIEVYRNGKAKKTDAPIPEDWAPISGSGKRKPRQQQEEGRMFLDPIKFRYTEEAVVEEVPPAPQEEAGETKSNRRRRNRGRKPEGKKGEEMPKAEAEKPAKTEKPPKPDKKDAHPKADKKDAPAKADKPEKEDKSDKPKSNHRRPHYRRRKPKAPGEGQQ